MRDVVFKYNKNEVVVAVLRPPQNEVTNTKKILILELLVKLVRLIHSWSTNLRITSGRTLLELVHRVLSLAFPRPGCTGNISIGGKALQRHCTS